MSHKKRQDAYRNAKISLDQGEKIRVPIHFSAIRRGDGVNGLIEDIIDALELAKTQFYMETAGMGLVGISRIDISREHYIESGRVELETPPPEALARMPSTLPGARASEEPVKATGHSPAPPWQVDPQDIAPGISSATPETEQPLRNEPAPDPARRELALQQALKLLEDFREGVLTYREDVVARIEESVWPELVHSIVTQVDRKFVSKTSGADIRWNAIRRIPDALPTREQLELIGTIRALKKEGKGVVQIKVDEVISKQHTAAINALRRRGTGSVPLGYATDAVRKRLSLFDSTPHLLRFKGSASKGLVAGDRFDFLVTSVELADPDETLLREIEREWHEELHRK